MSGSNRNGPKIMSSRLAGMKFMQRTGSAPNSPSTPAGPPPSKKQRLSNGSALASPSTPKDPDTPASQQGETKWYLSFKAPQASVAESPLRIVSAGYSSLDANGRAEEDDDDEEEDERPRAVQGRKSFGKFNKKLEKQQNPDLSSSSSSEDSSSDSEDGELSDDPTGVKALIAQGRKEATDRARADRKAKKKEKEAESKTLAEQRRKKEVNLNRVTSISGGGGGISGGGGRGAPSAANITCYQCNQKGHRKQDCPELARGGRRY